MDDIDELVDWQLSNAPEEPFWTCADCGMNWVQPPRPCPCKPTTHQRKRHGGTMIRRLLRRLFGPSGDAYVVVDWHRMRIAGVSARQQGAERLRAEHADAVAERIDPGPRRESLRQYVYDHTKFENHELQDTE